MFACLFVSFFLGGGGGSIPKLSTIFKKKQAHSEKYVRLGMVKAHFDVTC